MVSSTFDRLLMFSLFFTAYWFFGNLYEQIVLVPNHLVDTYETMKAYHGYFKLSSPTFYFVPITGIAIAVIWFLYFHAKDVSERRLLKRASFFGLLAIVTTVGIVTQINLKLFSPFPEKIKDDLYILSIWWLIGNTLRIYLVGSTLYYLFKSYILRQVRINQP